MKKYPRFTNGTTKRREFGNVGVMDRMTKTDELIKEIYKSVNTNYDIEKERYKEEKKLTTV